MTTLITKQMMCKTVDNPQDGIFVRFSIHIIFFYFQKQYTFNVQDDFLSSNFTFTYKIDFSIHFVPDIQEGKSRSTTFRVFQWKRFHLI